jgi:hypothetical protein
MRTFLGTVLSVIAVGVMLIAYGLLAPRAAAAPYGVASPDANTGVAAYQLAQPAVRVAYVQADRVPLRAPARRVVVRATHRNWQKTALVIGGSTAAGAGLGAIIGGKKGALIGAAIGGGASSLFEATRR